MRDAAGELVPAADALGAASITPLELREKEGLALINGTDGMLGMLLLALHDLSVLLDTADAAAAMSIESQLGTDAVFAADLMALRPQVGQAASAANLRAFLADSAIMASHRDPAVCTRVQDAYSLRCSPQVHGAARDTVDYARTIAFRELASAVDNPVITNDGRVESNGNFHGAPVAYVLDFLAIAVADVASISERRTDRALDPARSHGLPPFLAHEVGVDSGLMIAQYAAAGIVSELKRLAVPASVDSIPSSAMQEDHVSMGWAAARKLRRGIDGLARVLAIEVLTAARALDLRAPLQPGPATAAVRDLVRTVVDGPGPDRHLSPEMEAVTALVASGAVRAAALRRRRRSADAVYERSWSRRGRRRRRKPFANGPGRDEMTDTTDTASRPRRARRRAHREELGRRGRQAHAHEQPRSRGRRAPRGPRRLRRHRQGRAQLGGVRRDRPHARRARARRDAPRAVRQAGRRVPHARVGAARAHRELEPRGGLGDVARVPPPRGARPHDVRADDRRILDLHRHPGHPAGHLRDVRGGRAPRSVGTPSTGTLTLTGGCGGMGGAQPLAVTMNGGAVLIVDVDESRLARRVEHGYLDEYTTDLDEAIARVVAAKAAGEALSVGVVGNAAEVFPELLPRGTPIDIVTDQTSAARPARLPAGGHRRRGLAAEAASRDPEGFTDRARGRAWRSRWRAMVGFQDAGAAVFDYGNSIRREAELGGFDRAFEFPGFVPAYIRPLFAEGKGPFRWVALSGDPEDIAKTDRAVKELFPEDAALHRWLEKAGEKVHFEGLPARICWLGYKERHLAGLKFNEMVASGELAGPIVIGRDHLDAGSVASPYRETEAMADGSDAIADWPLLNALLNTASGAAWVSIHHGGGVGIGRSIHAGQVTVADGTALAAEKLERVLTNDPGTGRHAARRRRLRPRQGGRARARPEDPDAVTDAR